MDADFPSGRFVFAKEALFNDGFEHHHDF